MSGRSNQQLVEKRARSLLPRIMVYEYRQDDPKKCTSARMRKFKLVQNLHSLKQIPPKAIVLNPTSPKTLSHEDRKLVETNGLVGLDCSWNLSDEIFDRNIPGENRRLPVLLAGNPTNYGIAARLSTAEALAAALVITGYTEHATEILSLFKWGKTFLSLNKEPIEKYASAEPSKISLIEDEYFQRKQG